MRKLSLSLHFLFTLNCHSFCNRRRDRPFHSHFKVYFLYSALTVNYPFPRLERKLTFIMGGKWSSMDPLDIPVPELDKLLDRDPYLKPYEKEIRKR